MLSAFAPSALSPNLRLLDARATGRTLSELHHMFLPVDFFDLCSMIEEMVIRPKIVLVGKFDKLPKQHRLALQPFVDARVFEICVDRIAIRKLQTVSPQLIAAGRQAFERRLTSSTIADADFEVTRLLAAEVSLRIPTIPLLRHLHNYGFTRRPAVDHAVCELSARYGDIRSMAEEQLRFEAQRTRVPHMSVPPIALQVMQRARYPDDLPQAILEIWHEHSELRTMMTDLAERLGDPALEFERHLRLVRQWERRWQEVADTSVGPTMGLGLSSYGALAHGVEFVTAFEAEHWFGIAASALRLVRDAGHFLRGLVFRPMHYSVRNYLRTGHRGMAAAVGRLYGISPSVVHRQLVAVGTSTSVWRAALDIRASTVSRAA